MTETWVHTLSLSSLPAYSRGNLFDVCYTAAVVRTILARELFEGRRKRDDLMAPLPTGPINRDLKADVLPVGER